MAEDAVDARARVTVVRDAGPADFDAILRLNRESERLLSPLDLAGLERLHAQAAWHRVAGAPGEVAAFLLVLREGQDYASPNYGWFAQRYDRFLYVDRIVVAQAARGHGLGPRLYEDLFAFARASGVPCITCEFDVDPPNAVSERFHRRFGFREVGRHRYGVLAKEVALQEAPVPPPV